MSHKKGRWIIVSMSGTWSEGFTMDCDFRYRWQAALFLWFSKLVLPLPGGYKVEQQGENG